MQTEKDFIEYALVEVVFAYSDGRMPEAKKLGEIRDRCYESLFKERDGKVPRVLDAPVLHELPAIFWELKFGRTAEDQQFLNECKDLYYEKFPAEKKNNNL